MSAFKAKIGETYIIGSTLLSTITIAIIGTVLLVNSFDAITSIGWELFSNVWSPSEDRYGIMAMFYSSVVVTIIALFLAIPLGLMTAIYTSEILDAEKRPYVKSLLELLAGVPSIIYGLIGVAFFSIWIQDLFELQSGRTILTAGILLAIMILPGIITLADDSMQNVPRKYRESALGMGFYPYEVILRVVLPMAKGDIAGSVLLAVGRALGETMAVMLVIGGIDRIPNPVYNFLNPGQTLTSKLGREIAESAFGTTHFSALIFIGLMLLVIVLTLTIFTQYYFKKEKRLHE